MTATSPLFEMAAEVAALLDAAGRRRDVTKLEVRAYAEARARHLATLAGKPGFGEALVAERDNVALFAGIAESDSDEELRGRIAAVVQRALVCAVAAMI
ncbi:MAG: hypothetical protein L0323_19095 [Planctomycetes bacterium]|nr:hypothetical protein [Planctomycetota bacterium]